MIVNEYILRCRNKLGDDIIPYRIQNNEIVESLNYALQLARNVRPSVRYSNGLLLENENDKPFQQSVNNVVRTELDRYAEAFILLAAARILTNDVSDTYNPQVAERWRLQAMEILAT